MFRDERERAGIREPPCVGRRARSLLRGTDLPNLSDYDYRDPRPIRGTAYPTIGITESYQVGGIDTSLRVDHALIRKRYDKDLSASMASTHQHNSATRSRYDGDYCRDGYFNAEMLEMERARVQRERDERLAELLKRVPMLAPGTYETQAYRFREEPEVHWQHTGKFEYNAVTDETLWSCCGSSVPDARGCAKRVRKPYRPNYTLGPF